MSRYFLHLVIMVGSVHKRNRVYGRYTEKHPEDSVMRLHEDKAPRGARMGENGLLLSTRAHSAVGAGLHSVLTYNGRTAATRCHRFCSTTDTDIQTRGITRPPTANDTTAVPVHRPESKSGSSCCIFFFYAFLNWYHGVRHSSEEQSRTSPLSSTRA